MKRRLRKSSGLRGRARLLEKDIAGRVRELSARRGVRGGAAAAGLLGVAATAGKLGLEHRRDRDGERHFGVLPGEPLAEGLRRTARGRIDEAIAHLQTDAASTDRGPTAEGVHGARKDIKRLRAMIRVLAQSIGTAEARADNAALRSAGRRLADARDGAVLLERLDELRERHDEELQADELRGLETVLRIEHERAVARLRNDPHETGLVVEALESLRRRVASWDPGEDPEAIVAGVRRVYARGRARRRAAMRDPSLETLHNWRKRVKDLRHAAELLEGPAPRSLHRVARRADKLGEILGEEHDLALLAARAGELAPDAAAGTSDGAPTQAAGAPPASPALVGLIERRRAALLVEARRRGRKLYRQRPGAFARGLRRELSAPPRPSSTA